MTTIYKSDIMTAIYKSDIMTARYNIIISVPLFSFNLTIRFLCKRFGTMKFIS